MSQVSRTDRQSGFTIIEVLIVLDIAGIFAILIFQAIPALNRSSRNNQRKNGVAGILTAFQSYGLSNSGLAPPNCGGSDPSCQAYNAAYHSERWGIYGDSTSSTVAFCQGHYNGTVLAFGDAGNDSLCNGGSANNDKAPVADIDSVVVYNYQICDSAVQGGGTSKGAGYYDMVALYALESGDSGHSSQCQEI